MGITRASSIHIGRCLLFSEWAIAEGSMDAKEIASLCPVQYLSSFLSGNGGRHSVDACEVRVSTRLVLLRPINDSSRENMDGVYSVHHSLDGDLPIRTSSPICTMRVEYCNQ